MQEDLAMLARLAFVVVSLFAMLPAGAQQRYADRWVYVSRNLTKPEHVDEVRAIAATAHEHGLNGMLLAGGLEGVGRWDATRLARLDAVKAACQENRIEIIPIIWSVGYGSGLGFDRNLAAGLPCTDVPFQVEGKAARFVPDPGLQFANPGFEEHNGKRMKGYRFHDRPGEVSFVDTEIRHGGKASLRFENFGSFPHGHARVMQELTVQPHREYRLSCWVKTENLGPASAFRIQIYGPKNPIAPVQVRVPATSDWQQVGLVFNSREYSKVKVYAGLWGGETGKFWLDDFAIREMALVNVLRRPGTPVTVTSADGQTIYEEGKDYEPVVDDRFNLRHPRADCPALKLTENSRIQNGQRLRVSYYHGLAINGGQVSVCMSEPELYDYWRRSAAAIKQHLDPDKWFLSMDEIRAGGSCAACKARNLTMGEILGDCITKQNEIIHAVKPDAKVYIWSDMLDPNHNAHGDYFLVDGDFSGSWEHIPKDMVICCWYFKKREESMRFFSGLGFETLAGAYYDGDDLENIKGWLETVGKTPKCRGIMYTTWRNKYRLLPAFGDLLR
jgi:hypothetical protein